MKNNDLTALRLQKKPRTKPVKDNILMNEFKSSNKNVMPENYKPARLYTGGKQWYIYYSFRDPHTGNFTRFKEYFDINRIKSTKDKLQYGRDAVDFINKKLIEGFNPFTAKKKCSNDVSIPILQQLKIVCDALRSKQTKVTCVTYTTMENRFKNFILKESLQNISLLQVDVTLAEKFKTYLLDNGLARKTINATISHLSLFWQAAIDEKIIDADPFKNVRKVKRESINTNQEDIFEPLTKAELTTIFEHLNNNGHRNYLRFLAVIYLAWARPIEITRLKVQDIDLNNAYIKFKKAETKNAKGSFVQIVPQLKEILQELQLEKYPGNFYLFGNNFLPAEAPMYFKLPGKLWNKVVKALEIDKRMYALKHTGNIEYLHASKDKINIKWQQAQNRHKTAEMTERYNRQLGAYFIDVTAVQFSSLQVNTNRQ